MGSGTDLWAGADSGTEAASGADSVTGEQFATHAHKRATTNSGSIADRGRITGLESAEATRLGKPDAYIDITNNIRGGQEE